MNEKNKNIVATTTKGNAVYNLEYIPVFNNCEKINNYDFYEPVCPITPYKVKFNNLIKILKLSKSSKNLLSLDNKKKNDNKIKPYKSI